MQELQPLIDSLQGFAKKRLGFKRPPKLFYKKDPENASNILGKTAYYDPQDESITLFVSNRHPKDVLRSYAHELVHHTQNLRGDLSAEKCGEMGMGYAQTNPHMREMEREAYEKGNMCFRDWEDNYKTQINIDNVTINLKENKKMVKISKKELKGLIGKILEAKLEKQKAPEEIDEGGCGNHKRDDDTDEETIKEGEGHKCAAGDQCKGDACPACKENAAAGAKCECPKEDKDSSAASVKQEVQTPEEEHAIYENRFGQRDENIFNKLTKLWTR